MILYPHQQRFINKNPKTALLVWETGTGKTLAACEWLRMRPDRMALVVCPKAIVGKWKADLAGIRATVVTRDEVKKLPLHLFTALVIDEAHDFASPIGKGRSERTTVIYEHLRTHPNTHVLLLTATPIRSTPWNIHTLAAFLGIWWEPKKFQNEFFYLTDLYGRFHYEPKKGWQTMIRKRVEEIADIVLMRDCVDVPQQHEHVREVTWTPRMENDIGKKYLTAVSEWHERHRRENGKEKFAELEKIIDGYRKVIVVCHYREQMESYIKKIGDSRLVYQLHGDTKDQGAVIAQAKSADDCIFFVQAQMGAGFDAAEFSVVVFASMSFRYVDHVQMRGRVKRINNLHENLFIYLLGGKCDRAVYSAIMKGKDFDVHEIKAIRG